MIEHLTKDTSWHSRTNPPNIHQYRINNDTILDTLIEMINDRGDEEYHRTNLKCNMTRYRSWKEDERMDEVAKLMKSLFEVLPLDWVLSDMWGAKYESEEYAKEHDHGNSEWSFCIYLNEGQGFPPLIVHDKKIYPKRGLVVIFPGWVRHSVPSEEFDGNRYVVAGNILLKKDLKPFHMEGVLEVDV